jgi:hypothetical protein
MGILVLFILLLGAIILINKDTTAAAYIKDKDPRPLHEREKHERLAEQPKRYSQALDGRNTDMGWRL